jgi:hypothetical protein
MFPSNGSATRRLLPSPGSPRVGFAGFRGTMRRSDSLPPSRRASLCFAWRYHEVRRWFAPAGPARATDRPGLGDPVPRPDMARGERRASQVPGGPWCAYAVFSDPGRTGHPSPWRGADAAPVLSKTKAPAGNTLEAQWHGLGTGCLRFVGRLTPPHARLASGCWLGFAGWDWLPTESLREVSKVYSLHLFLLSQASLGARTEYRRFPLPTGVSLVSVRHQLSVSFPA